MQDAERGYGYQWLRSFCLRWWLYDWLWWHQPNHQEAKDAPLDHTRFLWLYIFPRTSLFASEFLQPRLFWWLLGPKAYLTHTGCLIHFTRVKKPAHSNLTYSFIPIGLPLKSSFTFPIKTGVQVLMETGEKKFHWVFRFPFSLSSLQNGILAHKHCYSIETVEELRERPYSLLGRG